MTTFETDDGNLIVTPDHGDPLRLSLLIPFEDVERWVSIGEREDNKTWLDEVRLIRPLMPKSASEQLDAMTDGAMVVQCVREWQRAFSERLGKSLLFSGAGGVTGQS